MANPTAAVLSMTLIFSGAAAAFGDEEAASVLADKLRQQGFACDKPKSAERDPAASKPDGAVWIVTCEGASYRMRVVPDMAAQVEKLKK